MLRELKNSTAAALNVLPGKEGTVADRLYTKLFWCGIGARDVASQLLSFIPDDFGGRLLEISPDGPVYTEAKYAAMKNARIEIAPYDGGALPYPDGSFDALVCFDGLHRFADKEAARAETIRVLKSNGLFFATTYIKNVDPKTDKLVRDVLVPAGRCCGPFFTATEVFRMLDRDCYVTQNYVRGPMFFTMAVKR